jgi:hypothetical protein
MSKGFTLVIMNSPAYLTREKISMPTKEVKQKPGAISSS